MFEFVEIERPVARIKVIGIGGAGNNAINTMVAANVFGVEFIAVNTDVQHLESSLASVKVQIGTQLTKGLGAGSNPIIGRQAAVEDKDALSSCVEGADMVFITCGMGGGTGTGAAPVVATLAKELGILTVGVVTKPFYFEGRKRAMNAEEGLKEFRKYVDTLIVIPNDRIGMVVEKGTPLLKSFAMANDVLRQAVQGISDVILKPGLVNLDFADVRAIMENAGKAVIGMGVGTGEGGAGEAARKAIANQLLEETSIAGAKRILINITGGLKLSIDDFNDVGGLVYDAANDAYDAAHGDRNIIIGAVIDPDMDDEYHVTVIATALDEKVEKSVLSKVPPWSPKTESVTLRGSSRIISKNIGPLPMEPELRAEAEELPATLAEEPSEALEKQPGQKTEQKLEHGPSTISLDDEYDVPTFLRKRL